MTPNIDLQPDIKISVKQTFGLDSQMEVDAFSQKSEYVPELDKTYKFDRDTTLALISGFAFNKRVLVQGYHGTGKSTHIEQIAARLNWPCIRVNLDSHISRIDLIGKDAIVLKDGKQVTEFKEGILPWAFQSSVALVFDEYDAGRSEIQYESKNTLLIDGSVEASHSYNGSWSGSGHLFIGGSGRWKKLKGQSCNFVYFEYEEGASHGKVKCDIDEKLFSFFKN